MIIPNPKKKGFFIILSSLFSLGLVFFIYAWIKNEKSGGKVELGRLILGFFACWWAFSGFCLWKLFLRLKVKEFTRIDWLWIILFFLPVFIWLGLFLAGNSR